MLLAAPAPVGELTFNGDVGVAAHISLCSRSPTPQSVRGGSTGRVLWLLTESRTR
jgi:hypothetical protein